MSGLPHNEGRYTKRGSMEQLPEEAFHKGHKKTSSNKSGEVDLRREQFKDALSKTIAAGGVNTDANSNKYCQG